MTHQHEARSCDHPTEVEVPVDPETDHLFNAIIDSLPSKDPANGDGLEKHAPEQGHSRSRVEIPEIMLTNENL